MRARENGVGIVFALKLHVRFPRVTCYEALRVRRHERARVLIQLGWRNIPTFVPSSLASTQTSRGSLRDNVGLSVNKPDTAIVLSVDE